MSILDRILRRHPDLRPHTHKWKRLKWGCPILFCKCGVLKAPELQVGDHTVSFAPVGASSAPVIRYSGTTAQPAAAGQIGMSLESGRPIGFIDGKEHALAIASEVPPVKFWEIQNEPNSTTLVQKGINAAPTVNGTPTIFDTNRGEYVRYTSAAGLGSDAGLISATFDKVQRQFYPSFTAVLRFPVITDIRMWVGLFSATPMGSATPLISFAGFRFDTGAGDAVIQAVTGDGVGTTVASTAFGPVAADEFILRVWIDESAGTAHFSGGSLFTGGTRLQLLTSISTTMPAAATDLGYCAQVRNLVAVAKTFDIAKISMAQFPPVF